MSPNSTRFSRALLGVVVAVFALRFISLPFDVLSDPTEARYAEIGRAMAASGDYITPMLSGAPFWAKPPLSFWATAASINVFGANEFGAKLPHFLFIIASVALVYFFARRWRGPDQAAAAAAVLATMPLVAYWAGGVMTDPALVFSMTLAMVGFYNAINGAPKYWGYLFFAGLALGLLAKGPLILVFVGATIFLFVLAKNKWRDLWKNVPIFSGALLMLAVAAPWYILAERATPGFLEYFFIGEHFQRYVVPNWAGDKYGVGHGGFIGKIWLFYLLCVLPWSAYLAVKAFSKKFRASLKEIGFFRDEFLFYALLFAAIPLVFFTFSKNILITYAIAPLVPTALLLAAVLPRDARKFKWFAALAMAPLAAMTAADIFAPRMITAVKPTEKFLVREYLARQPGGECGLYYYNASVPYSAEFYSRGAAERIDAGSAIPACSFVVVRDRDLSAFAHGEVILKSNRKNLVRMPRGH